MSLPSFSVRRPVSTLVALTSVAALGLLAIVRLSVDFLPPVSIPRIVVSARVPDAQAASLEHRVTRPLEDWLTGLPELRTLSSITRRSDVLITATFQWGKNIEEAAREVRERVEKAMPHLPADLERPTVLTFDPASDPIMMIGVVGRDSSGSSLRHLAHLRETARALIKKRLEQIEGVARVDVVGGVERQLRIELDPARMRALRIQPASIPRMIAGGGVTASGGMARLGGLQFALNIVGEFHTLAEILATPVLALPEGRRLRLGEIARGVDTIADRSSVARINGQEAVTMLVRTDAGSNSVLVSRRVRAELRAIEEEMSRLSLPVVSDDAEFIERAVTDVGMNMLVGTVLAVAVVIVSLRNMRDPFIAAVAIPVSVLGTFLAMWCLGVRVNIISLAGLGLGIGMLGDNALVVIEYARQLRERGTSPQQSAIRAAEQLQGPLTASTLTNAAIFLPILIVPGVSRELFSDLAVTMTSALAVSLVVSLTLVPLLLSQDRSPPRRPADRATEVRRWRAPNQHVCQDAVVRWSVRHRGGVVAGSSVILLATVAVGWAIPTAFVPAIDQRRLVLAIGVPGSMPLDSLIGVGTALEQRLLAHPGISMVVSVIGGGQTVRPAALMSTSISMEITPAAGWATDSIAAYARQCAEGGSRRWPLMRYGVGPRPTAFEQILHPFTSGVSVQLLGDSEPHRGAAMDSLMVRLRHVRGLVDLKATTAARSPELQFIVDSRAAAAAGLTPAEIITQMAGYLSVRHASDLRSPEGTIPIAVTVQKGAADEGYAGTAIVTDHGSIPLRSLGHWERTLSEDERWRVNREDAGLVFANVSGRSLAAVLEDIENICRELRLPSGSRWQIGGEYEEIRYSFTSLLVVLGLSLVAVFMILAGQYESFRWASVVLLLSPLAVTGAVAALVLSGESYSVFSLIGVVIMIGAIDNDAVIVIDVAVALRREGHRPLNALREAYRRRLRSIILTTATSVLAMMPFLFGIGAGLEIITSLTVPLAGGLVTSTVVTLVVLPAVYALSSCRRAG